MIVENAVLGNREMSVSNRPTFGPTSGYEISTSGTPTLASNSASAMVAHLCFVTPASSCIFAISAVLCVLTCGRSRSVPPAIAMMAAIFSRMSAG